MDRLESDTVMTRVAADTDWLRRIGGLTVAPEGDWPDDQVLAAKLQVARLVNAARGVTRSTAARQACSPHVAALAVELADADVPELPTLGAPRVPELVARYEQALTDVVGAVYFCRRTEHASGRCWFSPAGPSADICGRVLGAGHRSACSH